MTPRIHCNTFSSRSPDQISTLYYCGNKSLLVNSWSQLGQEVAVKEVTTVQLLQCPDVPVQGDCQQSAPYRRWSLQRGQEPSRSQDMNPEQAFQKLQPSPCCSAQTHRWGCDGRIYPCLCQSGPPLCMGDSFFSPEVSVCHLSPGRGSH